MIRQPRIDHPTCSLCGTRLIEREGFKNWKTFLVCPNHICPKNHYFKEQLFGESMNSLFIVEEKVNAVV